MLPYRKSAGGHVGSFHRLRTQLPRVLAHIVAVRFPDQPRFSEIPLREPAVGVRIFRVLRPIFIGYRGGGGGGRQEEGQEDEESGAEFDLEYRGG